MNSKTLRRLAADHSALHYQPLPPNYLFAPDAVDNDDLTQLDILLAGPTHTPFAAGVWKLHLSLPSNYPEAPPTANFRTPIFHPNVDAQTGGVCVETLKRDWDARLTLRDVLITISCLLIQPNPDSALNAEAGALIQNDYNAFARRAQLMTSIHALVPREWQEAVKDAQTRGQETSDAEEVKSADGKRSSEFEDSDTQHAAPIKRRRIAARQTRRTAQRRSAGSPSAAVTSRRYRTPPGDPFVAQIDHSDPFDTDVSQHPLQQLRNGPNWDGDSNMVDADQENDETRSPAKPRAPARTMIPRRPCGVAIPLGELSMDDASLENNSDDEDDDDMELEYPPSPRKSPMKRQLEPPPTTSEHILDLPASHRAESSRAAVARAMNITPPQNRAAEQLATKFLSGVSISPRKGRKLDMNPFTPPEASMTGVEHAAASPVSPVRSDRLRPCSSPAAPKHRRLTESDAKLWTLCGGDIRRWNRGQFDGDVLRMKARRW